MAQEVQSPTPRASTGSLGVHQARSQPLEPTVGSLASAPQVPNLNGRSQSTSGQTASSLQWIAQGLDMESPRRHPGSTAASGAVSARAPALGLNLSSSSHLSDNGAGNSSSSSTPLRGGATSARKSSGSGALSARANYESALLSAVRRQIESFEEKVGGQISTLRCQQQRDRLREAAITRLEEKMSSLEGHQPRLDQRLAELSGNFKGLSDEMQAQIRRVDLMDDRLWEWRHQIEEEFRQKYADFEHSINKVCSGVRVMASANEEGQRRLSQRVQALEEELRDRLDAKSIEPLHERLEVLEGRCQSLEEQAALEAASASLLQPDEPVARGVDAMEEAANAALLGLLERRVGDIADRLDQMIQDSREAHGKLAIQEEQQRTMRTLFEGGEERLRVLADRMDRGDWDKRLDQLRQAHQEESRQNLEQRERLELLGRRLEYQEQAHEELRNAQQLRASRDASPRLGADAAGAAPAFQEWQGRVLQTEVNLGLLRSELEALRADADLAPRVGELVASLKEVMPKVVAHDRAIQLLQARPQDNLAAAPAAVSYVALEEALGCLRCEMAELARASQEPVQHLLHSAAGSQAAAESVLAELRDLARGLAAGEAVPHERPPDGEVRQEIRSCARLSAESQELAAGVLGELAALRRQLGPGSGADMGQ